MRQSMGRFIVGLVLVTGVGVGTGLGVALVAPGIAGATAPFTVNDTGDYPLASSGGTTCVSTNDGSCTLRAAIEASNNLDAPMTIDLPNGTYTLNDATYGSLVIDDLSGGVGQLVTIQGNNASLATIEASATQGAATTRVLKVDPDAAADISGVTITNGDSSNSGEVGGAILNCATLTLTASVVSDSQTNAGEGGGIYTESAANTTLVEDTIIGNSGSAGGGIYADAGTMDLNGVVVSANTASGDGGGVYTAGTDLTVTGSTIGGTGSGETATNGNTAQGGSGGGLALFGGTATLSDNVIGETDPTQGNKAVNGDGGGVFDSVEDPSFTGDDINDNTADNGDGGGLYVANGTSTFTDETIVNNLAVFDDTEGGDGGGVYIDDGNNTFSGGNILQNTSEDGDDGDGGGGGVYINNGTNSFSDGTVATNSVTDGGYTGGGFAVEGGTNAFTNETIGGPSSSDGNTITEASAPFGAGGGVYVDGGTNTFTGTTVDSNQAYYGGGFYYQGGINTFSGGSIDSNQAYAGGGAYVDDGTETFTQADISSNMASEAGGGLFIYVEDPATPTTVTASTISQNTAEGISGATVILGDGGGILAENCDQPNQINLTNDTIAGNRAGGVGGGYYGTDQGECQSGGPNQPAAKSEATAHVVTAGTTDFVFDTIDANTSGEGGGNINTDDDSTLDAAQTIIADGVSGGIEGDNCTFIDGGTLTSLGYNLIDDTTCGTPGTGDIIGQSPRLGALGANGGPTNTDLPATGSPAIGAVPAAVCMATGVTTDQRGNA
ncbi:MAG TPA: choice-of-anchor Q domain-containing protein, partial [Acidimicrobiales bacterium]